MPGKRRRRQPAPPASAEQVPQSLEKVASEPEIGGVGVKYDANELFPDSRRLSVREKEALELAVDGKTNGEIAIAMGNSKRTVENFVAKIVEKLDVADRNEATARYHHATVARLVRENAECDAKIYALEERVKALRRQLRHRP